MLVEDEQNSLHTLLIQKIMDSQANAPIVVVCAADNNYAMPLSVTICSVLENLNPQCKLLVFIIDGGIKEHNKRRVQKSISSKPCELRWITIPDSLLKQIKVITAADTGTWTGAEYISIASYYRLLISDLLPQTIDKAIYLDSDLVVKGDLELLWNIDVEENYLLAVQDDDRFCPYVSSPRGLSNWKELGFSANSPYFNAGVIVFNLAKWRSETMCAKALDYLANNRQYIRWHDQDVLNATVRGQWKTLDSKWNRMVPQSMTQEDVEAASIIHFTSPAKPWTTLEPYVPRNLYYQYLDKTDWSGYRLTLWRRLWRRLHRELNHVAKLLLQGWAT